LKSKIATTLLMGVLVAIYFHHEDVKWNERGRDAYIACQTQIFDKSIASPRPLFPSILTGILAMIFVLGGYELIVFLFSKILNPKPRKQVST